MSVVILGGNTCMIRQYKDTCKMHNFHSKIFVKGENHLRDRLGHPDLVVLFTQAMSHNMLHLATGEAKKTHAAVVHAKSGSVAELTQILKDFQGGATHGR